MSGADFRSVSMAISICIAVLLMGLAAVEGVSSAQLVWQRCCAHVYIIIECEFFSAEGSKRERL